MKFYFPDSVDQISPTFDFAREAHADHRIRQRDDLYGHEVLHGRPYDGVLVSKTIVDGVPGRTGRYTTAQRARFYRVGIREFFRLDDVDGPRLDTLGDCGAFSYVKDEAPPFSVDELLDYYDEGGFDAALSLDHVILAFQDDDEAPDDDWAARRDLTMQLAAEFRVRHRERGCTFDAVGVAQGWSPSSMALSVAELQEIGFRRIALGGMVALKTPEIIGCLQAIDRVRDADTQLHLLGVTRCEEVHRFTGHGVSSFDSTGPFRQAFKDETDNYWTIDGAFTALRIPQVEGNPSLMRKIRAGQIDQREAVLCERNCLRALRETDSGSGTIEAAVEALADYQAIHDPKHDRSSAYRATLEAAPWRQCQCGVCEQAGIDVAIFRGSERNKRRGFHNVWTYRQRLDRELRNAPDECHTLPVPSPA